MNIFESFLCDGVNGFADGVEECSRVVGAREIFRILISCLMLLSGDEGK